MGVGGPPEVVQYGCDGEGFFVNGVGGRGQVRERGLPNEPGAHHVVEGVFIVVFARKGNSAGYGWCVGNGDSGEGASWEYGRHDLKRCLSDIRYFRLLLDVGNFDVYLRYCDGTVLFYTS